MVALEWVPYGFVLVESRKKHKSCFGLAAPSVESVPTLESRRWCRGARRNKKE